MNIPPAAEAPKPKKVLPWSLAPLPEADESLSDTEAIQTTLLRNQAMRWLARREYAAQALILRLAEDAPLQLAEAVVHELSAAGLQSDRRYVAAKIQAQAKKFGWQRIVRDLKQAGIADALIQEAKSESEDNETLQSELQRALAVLQKKSPTPPTDMKAKASLMRFMQGRGFSWSVIQQALNAQKNGERLD